MALCLSDAGIFADFEKHGTKGADLLALEPSQKRQND
jgi:cardiolipin synthase A/B